MPAKVTLEATAGPLSGRQFEFDEPDLFIVGRAKDCHAVLPDGDTKASRHHCIIEIRPPRVSVRDLGSLNGTFVNGEKIGGRASTETPEEGAARDYRNVDLEAGDEVQVSETVFAVSIEEPVFCPECGREIEGAAPGASDPRCADCRKRAERPKEEPRRPAEPRPAPKPGTGASDDPVGQLIRMLMERQGVALQPARQGVREIPGYQVGKMLGKGGMGAVYLARRDRDGQEVAVKVMLAESPAGSRERRVFEREVEMQQRLGGHPNCVPVLDFDLEGIAAYFVMEYCAGGSVDTLMERRGGRLSVQEAAPIMLASLAGLQHAHEHDVVHRDLKPQNILLTQKENGIARLTDFGLAKDFALAGMSGGTRTGSVGGTPVFMPREQVINFKYMKPDTDVCGMAFTFYNMLTGEFTRNGFRSGRDAVNIILNEPYVAIRDRDRSIPRPLAAVIDRAASDNTRERYQTAAEFREAMAEVL